MASLLLVSPAWAKTDAEVRDAVQTVIMDRHPHDTPAWWRGLGANAPAVIEQMYGEDSSTYHHMRLLEGLGAFTDDPSAVEFIKQQADKTPDDVVRNAAIRSVATNQGAREEEWVSKYLAHADPHTRLLAAQMLRKIGSPSAKSKVDAFVAGERLSWVVAELKGEAPKLHGTLMPSGSTEDRLTAELSGTWHGYQVMPRPDQSIGMKSEPVEMHLSVKGTNDLSGDLAVKEKGKVRSLVIARATGKGAHWTGVLVEEFALPNPAPGAPKVRKEETPVDAELSVQAGNTLLTVRSPKNGGLIFLRRDPAQSQ